VTRPSLDASRAKLARAREHMESLCNEVRTFMKRDPFGITHEIDPKNGDDVWRLVVREPPPLRLSVIAGDVAHNLRSSLDHLIWQLALTQTRRPYKHAEFPIYSIKSHKVRECFDRSGRAKIRNLPPDAQNIIESVQPYHRRNATGRTLALLHQINNIDKHRIPLRAVARQTGLNIPLWCLDYLDAITGVRKHMDEVLRLRREPGRRDLDECDKKRIRVSFDLNISTPRARAFNGGIIALFNGIHRTIDEDILSRCGRFF